MALRSAEEYKSSLVDNRVVWYHGERVPNVCERPDLRVAVDHAAIDFRVGGGSGARIANHCV